MGNKKIMSIILSISIILSLFSIIWIVTVYAAPGDKFILWVTSDVHIDNNLPGNNNFYRWRDTVDDILLNLSGGDYEPDYAWINGDCVSNDVDNDTQDNQWQEFWSQYHRLNGTVDYKNITIGNHDTRYGLGNTPFADSSELNYVVTKGNVAFICIGDLSTSYNWWDGDGIHLYGNHISWLNTTIQTYKPNYNIILIFHVPLYDTFSSTTNDGYYLCDTVKFDKGTLFCEFINWTSSSGNKIDAIINGHLHTREHMNTSHGNTQMFIDGSTEYTQDCRTLFFEFEEGTKQIIVRERDHISPAWITAGNFPSYFNLTYDFDPDYESTPQFTAIDGGTNNTTTFDSTPLFNWTRITTASVYWLQVSDTQDDWSDGSLVINITNVNIFNYPNHYSENTTHVFFILPTSLSSDGTYYTRVRAYLEGG